jgi:hypothetical protein
MPVLTLRHSCEWKGLLELTVATIETLEVDLNTRLDHTSEAYTNGPNQTLSIPRFEVTRIIW